MEDDEFGDLYTDVLRPFSSSLSSAPPPHHSSPPPSRRPIDLNLDNNDDHDNDNKISAVANSVQIKISNSNSSSINNGVKNQELDGSGRTRVLSSSPDPKLPNYPHLDDKEDVDINFDIEEHGEDDNSAPVIPGVTGTVSVDGGADVVGGDWEEEESDSEDDLQIVLNDDGHGLNMGMDKRAVADGGGGDDDDDEDELVIVADGDVTQAMEEHDWGAAGEEGAADGERKDGGGETAGKGNAVGGPKVGYSNHVYHHHPFHSQFKYVRPGAQPMPGATTAGPGGVPGQVRPPINMIPIAGRGRGDWRPSGMKNASSMQKGYHTGFGMPWANGMSGRSFGGGLEFTLPSHKTIFDVDIDSFEDKPWKYPGVDMSDFFNFGLNEDSWKDYCKQLEQYRLETTMQSKIRVYESGRTEQEYDPDLPPELAAAAGMHDIPVDDSNLVKQDVGQIDSTKGPPRVRPPLPAGRPIQVEVGSGERLPSIDTRPPRVRDSDAIIEIVLQGSLDDDSSTGNGSVDAASCNPPRDARESSTHDDMAQIQTEYNNNDFEHGYGGQKGVARPYSRQSDIIEDNSMLPFRPEAPSQFHPGSVGQPVMLSDGDTGHPNKERRKQGKIHDRSPEYTPHITRDKRLVADDEEESVERMDGKHRPLISSPTASTDSREVSAEDKDVAVHAEPVLAEVSSGMERDEKTENEVTKREDAEVYSPKKQKLDSHVEPSVLEELDDGEDFKPARSSENGKARSGSSKDHQSWRDGAEDEVVQDGRTRHAGSSKRHVDDSEAKFRRKERDARKEMERSDMIRKGREGSYSRRDLDPGLAHYSHMRNEGYDRHKERENSEGDWLQKEEDLHSRKSRTEDTSRRERGDEMASRNRSKIRDGERSDREEHFQSRKQLDNANYRVQYDKDGSSRHREREDSFKIRNDVMDDYHSKRSKDEEYLTRDRLDKEEIVYGHRETSSRRRRERDDALDLRRRDDQQRFRDSLDDYHSVRRKDEVWLQKERGERKKEREELYKLKRHQNESLSKRENEEGRVNGRAGRVTEDKPWPDHGKVKDEYRASEKEYQSKDKQKRRRDRAADESYSHHSEKDEVYSRASQPSSDETRSRQERSSAHVGHVVNNPDNQRVHERKHKDHTKRNRESEIQSGLTGEMGLKGSAEQGNGPSDITMQRNSSKRHKEEASSDDEQQDSKRGRSKLERWTSHKERDYSVKSKSSASLKFKEIDKTNSTTSLEAKKLSEEMPKKLQAAEKHALAEEKATGDMENKDGDTKPLEDRHLDTVEKLKKRSERFKLPMPSEKDALAVKKMESEALPVVKSDAHADLEIKPERPARKRRWISS